MLTDVMRKPASVVVPLVMLLVPALATAADVTVPASTYGAVAYIICGDRQGSGALINASQGYVLTVGHVAMDVETRQLADSCSVSFVSDGSLMPRSTYKASVVNAVFDERTERDFAVLKLGARLFGPEFHPPELKTDEFAVPGDAVKVLGYPGGSQKMQEAPGFINGFSRGTLTSNAVIQEGNSGGPVVDKDGDIVGVATRVTYVIDENGQKTISHYESGDILGFINWLDKETTGFHDAFVTHADPARFDGTAYVARDEAPGCEYVVRTPESPTLFCLLSNGDRLVFPNAATYLSWFPDFNQVQYASAKDLASYRLVGNVTYKAGSLLKITTDPRVYVVIDSFGTMRWVPSEERARQVFGDAWAAKVRDVPDVFFVDYAVRDALN